MKQFKHKNLAFQILKRAVRPTHNEYMQSCKTHRTHTRDSSFDTKIRKTNPKLLKPTLSSSKLTTSTKPHHTTSQPTLHHHPTSTYNHNKIGHTTNSTVKNDQNSNYIHHPSTSDTLVSFKQHTNTQNNYKNSSSINNSNYDIEFTLGKPRTIVLQKLVNLSKIYSGNLSKKQYTQK